MKKISPKYCFSLAFLTCILAWSYTFAGNVKVHTVETEYQNGRHRVPLPIERSGEKTRPFYFGPRGAK